MKPKINGCRYVLAVKNLQLSADYYKRKLGFSTLWEGGGWHFLIRDEIKIMIGECPDERPASEMGNHSYFAYFEVENIDALYNEYLQRGVDIHSLIENKPWGQREFAVKTVDGHRINFGEESSRGVFEKYMEELNAPND
jgi:catechol 2,3-dioxygenase-like lactoylglutathione lyase family enzyme